MTEYVLWEVKGVFMMSSKNIKVFSDFQVDFVLGYPTCIPFSDSIFSPGLIGCDNCLFPYLRLGAKNAN